MRLLLKERNESELAGIRERLRDTVDDEPGGTARIVAVSFAVLGDVRLGGTRMSGMTHRLVGTDLDLGSPVFEASGPGTSFAFHGLGGEQRMLGGDESTRSPAGEPGRGRSRPAESPSGCSSD